MRSPNVERETFAYVLKIIDWIAGKLRDKLHGANGDLRNNANIVPRASVQANAQAGILHGLGRIFVSQILSLVSNERRRPEFGSWRCPAAQPDKRTR
jgi:hypothetical protein